MPSIEATVTLKVDGQPVQGFPVTRRITVDEIQSFNYEEAADNDTTTYSDLPVAQLTSIQFMLLRALEQPINLRVDGQTDGQIEINVGGFVLMMDVTNNAGSNRARVNNPDASAVSVLKGLFGGT